MLFYSSEVKFDAFSLQDFMKIFPLLCVYERSEIKLTWEILFVLGRDKKEKKKNQKKEKIAKLTTYSLQLFSIWRHAYLGDLGQFPTGIGIFSVVKNISVKATSA